LYHPVLFLFISGFQFVKRNLTAAVKKIVVERRTVNIIKSTDNIAG
jgi:fucose 4-O-acetylase-like acetyltransferase